MFKIIVLPGNPDFLDLPWHQPLEEWDTDRLVEVARGISRHVVRFVAYGEAIYALKELPRPFAEREYRLLRDLRDRDLPAVHAVGMVVDRTTSDAAQDQPAEELSAVLITRHLDFSLPYRTLFASCGVGDLRNNLLDALAELLVRLHLTGFFWGDCSLSNTLYRRDAGGLAAYLVDAETAELQPSISNQMRSYEIDIAEENIAGELLDLAADRGVPTELEPLETARELRSRYESLWEELTREEVFAPHERYRIDARLRRLNQLGFDVKEIALVSTGDGNRLRLETHVVEPGHHRRRLLMLTGLDVQENQARRLLNDIASFRAHLEQETGRELPESVVAYRWLAEVFEPAIAAIPPELRGKLEPAEIFHQILDHRWFLSEMAGRDVGTSQAVASYIENVLRFVPDERTLLDPGLRESVDPET